VISGMRGKGPAWPTSIAVNGQNLQQCSYCGNVIEEGEERYNMRFANQRVAYLDTYCFDARTRRRGRCSTVTIRHMVSGKVHKACAIEMHHMGRQVARTLAKWAQEEDAKVCDSFC